MDETMMNNEVEVMETDVLATEETTQDIVTEEASGGPSRGFVTLVVGGIAAIAVGTVIAIKRHKKKKAKAQESDAESEEIYEEEDPEENAEEVTQEIEVVKSED